MKDKLLSGSFRLDLNKGGELIEDELINFQESHDFKQLELVIGEMFMAKYAVDNELVYKVFDLILKILPEDYDRISPVAENFVQILRIYNVQIDGKLVRKLIDALPNQVEPHQSFILVEKLISRLQCSKDEMSKIVQILKTHKSDILNDLVEDYGLD